MLFAASRRGINIQSKARQISEDDFDRFKHIVAMDNSNYKNLLNFKNRESLSDFAEIKKIQDFSKEFNENEVPDPYFGGPDGFDNVLDILEDSVQGFLKTLM